jgi:hypothetical protein
MKQVHVPINLKKRKEIDIYGNSDTHDIQKSKYLKIDVSCRHMAKSKSLPKILNTGYNMVKQNFHSVENMVEIGYLNANEINQTRN